MYHIGPSVKLVKCKNVTIASHWPHITFAANTRHIDIRHMLIKLKKRLNSGNNDKTASVKFKILNTKNKYDCICR